MIEQFKSLVETVCRILLSTIDKMVRQGTKNKENKKEWIKKLIEDGARKIDAGHYDEGLKCFEKAIRLNPKSFGAHLAMTRGLREKGKDLQALTCGGIALGLANSSLERKLVYLELGTASLDAFKHSHFLEHANQSLDYYQLALEEDPTELRAVWNSIETHIEVVLACRSNDDMRVKHEKEVARKLTCLDESLMQQNDASLAARFFMDGKRIQRRLSERATSIPKFSEEIERLRMHAEVNEDLQNLQRHADCSNDGDKWHIKRGLAYVFVAVLWVVAGVLMNPAEGAETSQIETCQVEHTRSQPIEVTTCTGQAFGSVDDDEANVATVDPNWDEMKLLATVDPDWEEIKNLA